MYLQGVSNEMVKKICEVCGKEFEVRNYERDKRRFCSRKCVDLSKRKEKRGCVFGVVKNLKLCYLN
jgi:hypothetical protein